MARNRQTEDGAVPHESYSKRLREHGWKNFYTALLILFVIALLGVAVWYQYDSHVYTDYDLLYTADLETTPASQSLRMNRSLLTYSADGAHLTDGTGRISWNQNYEIQNMLMDENGGTVVFAGFNDRDIYVLNETERLGSFNVSSPIRDVAVSQNGRVTAVLSDSDSAWINTYSAKGDLLYTGQTHMTGSGYPIALALSPSGSLLMVSYLYVDSGTVKSTLAFYNLGEVGDNYTDYLVGGQDYQDQIIPEVGFLSNSMCYAVGDSRLMLYQGAEQPTVKAEYLFNEEVLSVFSGNGHVGLVFASDREGDRYRIKVYNSEGEQEGIYYFSLEYTDVLFEEKDFVIYNEGECLIRSYSDRTKFEGGFQMSVQQILPTDKAYRYVLVTDNTMSGIQLK
jgi:hypothetical protein